MLGFKSSCDAATETGRNALGAVRFERLSALWKLRNEFARDDSGSLTVFGLFSFVIIMILAGIGVDMVRQETLRTELQNTLDRAVLAATNLDNGLTPEDVVRDYFAKAGLSDYLDSVETKAVGEGRQVTAYVGATLPTYFMKFAGVDNLVLSSYGTAAQGLANLEVSLVLDVSNSMNSNNKFGNLTIAGQDFVDTIFNNSVDGTVAVSVVPYSTQVNAGATILGEFNLSDTHNKSHCINFGSDDFDTTAIDLETPYQQTAHFDPFYQQLTFNNIYLTTCDTNTGNSILPFSNSLTEIESKIAGLSADGNTSIDLGVKWGTALLDPSAQTLTSALISTNEVSSSMSGHPLSSSSSTLKVMVVMTDGVNTNQYYMPSGYRSGYSDIYLAPDGYISFETEKRSCNFSYCWTETKWFVPQINSWYDTVYGGESAIQLTWPEVWSRLTVGDNAYARYLGSSNANDYYFWLGATWNAIENPAKNTRLDAICTAAKNMGILIFTVGFEAPDDAADILKSCASSESHYYDVDGLEIADAFSAIATKVTELRLVE